MKNEEGRIFYHYTEELINQFIPPLSGGQVE